MPLALMRARVIRSECCPLRGHVGHQPTPGPYLGGKKAVKKSVVTSTSVLTVSTEIAQWKTSQRVADGRIIIYQEKVRSSFFGPSTCPKFVTAMISSPLEVVTKG